MILGIDEVGRGAWAGPMVVGAVVLGAARIDGLTDSKKLTRRSRERLAAVIKRDAAGIGLGWVSAATIDRIGLGPALKLAARRAVAAVTCDYDEIIIDGTVRLIDADAGHASGRADVTMLAKADLLIPAVSAASIVAKVARDAYMARLDGVFDGYGFAGHVGYGTAAHARALAERGVLPVHRQSFAPVAALLGTTRTVDRVPGNGARAEDVAADYLRECGHTVLDRNWKTPRCEIDIVSRKDGILYFTEVKYRRQDNQGGGLAAVTAAKLARMAYGAEVYATLHGALAVERRLSAIALSGDPPIVTAYVEAV